jgi:hypothetical protein
MSTLVFCELSRAKKVLARDAVSRRNIQSSLAHALSLVRIVSATTSVCVVCFFFSSSLVPLFSYSGRSLAPKELLATSLRLDNRAPLGAGNRSAPRATAGRNDQVPAKTKYLRGAAGIGLGSTIKYLRRTTNATAGYLGTTIK